MSRIGRKPLEIPKGVSVSITNDTISVKGAKSTLSLKRHKDIEIKQSKDEDGKDVVLFERKSNLGPVRAAHGLMRALVNNMITGVTTASPRRSRSTASLQGRDQGTEDRPVSRLLAPSSTRCGGSRRGRKNNLTLSASTSRLSAPPRRTSAATVRPSLQGQGIKYDKEVIVRKAVRPQAILAQALV